MVEEFRDNKASGRFELDVDGQIVYATYNFDGKILYINYVEAPPGLRGSGATGRLMEHIVEIANAQDCKIVPICGYAATWLRRHESAS
jgi:predicted GNAT family acetyltransferase